MEGMTVAQKRYFALCSDLSRVYEDLREAYLDLTLREFEGLHVGEKPVLKRTTFQASCLFGETKHAAEKGAANSRSPSMEPAP